MTGDHNKRKGSKCDALMNLFLLLVSYFDRQLICRQTKETGKRRKPEVKQHCSPLKYSLLLEQDNFSVVLNENLLRGRRKKKTHRSQDLPRKK